MSVKEEGSWDKVMGCMVVCVRVYVVVWVFLMSLYFWYVDGLIRKSVGGMEGKLLGLMMMFVVIWGFVWGMMMKRKN